MARRGWGGSIATAIGVAAGTGAAQLGFGYGLGIINWAPAVADAAPVAWTASLVWASWIAATSTILGAVCAHRLGERAPVSADASRDTGPGRPVNAPALTPVASDAAAVSPGATTAATTSHTGAVTTIPTLTGSDAVAAGSAEGVAERPAGGGVNAQFGLALAAGLGALVTALLIAVPARVAEAPDTATPQRVAAAYAMTGVVIGVLSAFWALRSRAAASNIVATVAWLWLLAVIAVVDGVLSGRGLTTAQLGIWQLSADRPEFWIRDYLYWPGAVLSLGSALVISLLTARRGAGSAQHRVGATVSGGAGPLLVALAYLLAVPRLSAIDPEQVSAHLIAPYAVLGGIGGSVLIASLAQHADRHSTAGGSGSPSGETVDATGPRVPAPRASEEEQREPAGADQDAAPAKGEGRRRRSPRRSD